MMGDLLWRASLLFPDPRMGKAAAVLCAASAICAANGHELAALAALAAVPITMNSKMTSAAESSMSSAD